MLRFKEKIIAVLIITMLFLSLAILPKALGITNATYEVSPDVIGFYGNFTIRFTAGSAIPGGGWIKISFPNSFELPCNCGGVGWNKTDFLVNGVMPTYNPDGNNGTNLKYVNITTPTNMNISQGSVVVIQIKETARIKNPSDPGTYALKISTSSEYSDYTTNLYEISYSSVQNVSLAILKNTIASATGVVVGFNTGLLGDLSEDDYINLKFDNNFTLPNYISPDRIKINGYKPFDSRIQGKVLKMTTPKGLKIASSSQVVVEIDEKANIVNPVTPGAYGITVSTSKEPKDIPSNTVEIKDRPFVKTDILITPDLPDGANGYYKTQPIVILLPQTNTGEAVQTFYHFDSDPETLFTVPLYVHEGVHTLYYYSRSSSATEEQKSADFNVDISPPQLNMKSPANNTITGEQFCTVQGAVSDNSKLTLIVNGSGVEPDVNGNFSYSITLSEGDNVIDVKAVDIAGNTSESRIILTLNTTTPTLMVSSPSNWQVFNDSNIPVNGIITPVTDVTVTVNGLNVVVNSDGSFEYALQLQNEGINAINIVAKHNISGREASKSIIVVYKPVILKKQITIVLKVGSKEAFVDSEKKLLDVAPYIDPVSNRTLVPLRFISEAFGATVDWVPLQRTVRINLNSKQIVLQIGNEQALVDGAFQKLDQPPVIKDGRTMVPIRFISEALGATVDWNNLTNTITITLPISG
ncbi:MAG: hypothetical protein COS89_09205 [Deltaproteobacteria bacterium CG07_land_8_20_14_0_80_38_7]|nr:MAG: hypothetical protein COS89_09205 [Deltaproteobacteria bacterium CG07_land_8_20_14_0_80_38_7]